MPGNLFENGYEHRIGAKLHDYEYNDTIDKEDLVPNIRKCIDSLYTASLNKQRFACGIKRVGGLMSDFKYNANANVFYGFSKNAYALKFPVKNTFFFTNTFIQRMNRNSSGYQRKGNITNINSAKHMKFFSLADYYPTPTWQKNDPRSNTKTEHYYGYRNPSDSQKTAWTKPNDVTKKDPPTVDNIHIKFNINDTANRPDIFTHRLLFFMNGQIFNDLMVYVEADYIIMVIDSDRGGIPRELLETYTDPKNDFRWTLIGIPFGNYFVTRGAVNGDAHGETIPVDGAIGVAYSETSDDYKINRSGDKKDIKPTTVNYHIQRDMDQDHVQWFDTVAQYGDLNSVYLTVCGFEDDSRDLRYSSINKFSKTTRTVSNYYPYDTDGYARCIETNQIYYKDVCMDNTSEPYQFLGTAAYEKFTSGVPQYLELIELKNVASVIDLGTNRIFKIGCDDNIPGPVPPENVLIFERDSELGLKLVHMVTGEYKESDLAHRNSKYDKEVLRIERPNEDMVPFKSVDHDSVYDYPKFIPIREKYNVPVSENEEVIRETQKYIDLYYPNIFKLEGFDAGADLIAVVFYDKTVNNAFINPLAKYMEYDTTYANNIVTGNVPIAIMNYIPAINRYTEDAYIHGFHTQATRAIEYQFKLDSLRELVNDDANRLVDIYDRKYNKDKNKINANVKYIIDLKHDKPDTPDDYKITHIYRDEIKITYLYSIDINIKVVIINNPNGTQDVRQVDGLTIYYNSNNTALLHLSDKDSSGVPFDESDDRFVEINVSTNTAAVPMIRTYSIPKSIYTFTMKHKTPATYPATVWIDGVRASKDAYYINSSAHASTVSIYSTAIGNASYIELEIYKLRDINSRYKLLSLGGKHDSVPIKVNEREKLWDAISPQNLLVAVAQDVIDPQTGEVVRQYKVPSMYELYWLIIGHTRYNKGVPVNIPIDPRDATHIYQYNVIKSLQSTINTETGEETFDEVVIMSDESNDNHRAIIGETSETYAGNVDMLKTFGDREYFKVLEDAEYNSRFTCACGRTVGLAHSGETCQFCHTLVSKRPLDSYYVTMLREGFYNRDRKRFFEYIPMTKDAPMAYITPITDYFANKDVMVKNTDVYYSKTYSFSMLNGRVIKNSITIENFEFDPTPSKYRLYMDGLLLDYDFDFVSSVNLASHEDTYIMGNPFTLFVRKEFDWNMQHSLIFEYLPYRYQLVHRSNETDGVIVLSDEYIRPYDPRNFDVYVDGKLLRDDEIEVITERRIVVKPVANRVNRNTYPVVSIYEKMHDSDVFDFIWRTHKTGFEYVDHDTPVIEVDDSTFYKKITKVIVKGENDDPDDDSGTVFNFNGIYVYLDEDENMLIDLTTRDTSGSMIDPDVDVDNKFVVVDYLPIADTDPVQKDITILVVPYSRTVSVPRKTSKDNIKRYPNDSTKTIDVRMAEPIKYSLDEQIIRSDADYRQARTPSYNSKPSIQ
jgi:hypothetical protein